MWEGKPINKWTSEEKNHFLTLLIGECWHEWKYEGQCKHCGASHWYGGASYLQECAWAKNENYLSNLYGFQSVKSFMERELPKVWDDYLEYTSKQVFDDWGQNGSMFDNRLLYIEILNKWLFLDNLIQYQLDNREEWVWCDAPHPALVYAESLKEEI